MDLTGWTGRSQIRPNESSAVILGTFTVTIADQVAVPGGVLLDMAPADTSLLPVTGGKYDVELTAPDGTVRTYLKGDVTVLPEVTR